MLVNFRADKRKGDKNGRTPLHEAAEASFHRPGELVQLFLEHGAEDNTRDRNQRTALHEVAKEGGIMKIEFMIEKKKERVLRLKITHSTPLFTKHVNAQTRKQFACSYRRVQAYLSETIMDILYGTSPNRQENRSHRGSKAAPKSTRHKYKHKGQRRKHTSIASHAQPRIRLVYEGLGNYCRPST